MSQERANARRRSTLSNFNASIDEGNKCWNKVQMLVHVASGLVPNTFQITNILFKKCGSILHVLNEHNANVAQGFYAPVSFPTSNVQCDSFFSERCFITVKNTLKRNRVGDICGIRAHRGVKPLCYI